jgi:hypothetical protein
MNTPSPESTDRGASGIKITHGTTPSPKAAETLAALRQAVAEALERKGRLGQYAVFWEDGQVVRVGPEALLALREP